MSLLPRALTRPVLLTIVVAAVVVAAATGCIPTRVPSNAHFPDCSMPVFDTTTTASRSALRPYLDEASKLTGMRFEWVGSKADARYGLTITAIPAGTPARIVGQYTEALHGVGKHGEHVVYGSIIRLRPNASAGIRRHEIGHLFGLAHNSGSTLMQEAPPGTATWSPVELASMRAMAARSGCKATVSYADGPAPVSFAGTD